MANTVMGASVSVNAFAQMIQMIDGAPLGTLLESQHELNVHFRGFEEHI